eukprot:2452703-Rhodomonas_salina.1
MVLRESRAVLRLAQPPRHRPRRRPRTLRPTPRVLLPQVRPRARANCAFSAHSLSIHCLFSAHSLTKHCLFSAHSLSNHVRFLHTARASADMPTRASEERPPDAVPYFQELALTDAERAWLAQPEASAFEKESVPELPPRACSAHHRGCASSLASASHVAILCWLCMLSQCKVAIMWVLRGAVERSLIALT